MKLADVKVNPTEKYGALDLEKVFGKKVKRIEGHISGEFGHNALVFQLSAIVFDDDERVVVEGEHDCPYIASYNREATFQALFMEARRGGG